MFIILTCTIHSNNNTFHLATSNLLYFYSFLFYIFNIFVVWTKKRNPSLAINDWKTAVDNNVIRFKSTDAEYAKTRRAFIDTVTSIIFLLSFFTQFCFTCFWIHLNSFKTICDLQLQVWFLSFTFVLFFKYFLNIVYTVLYNIWQLHFIHNWYQL